MEKYAISPAAPLFATLTLTNDEGHQVKVNPHQLQICGSAHLNKLIHAVQHEDSACIKVKYVDLEALRDAVHYCDLYTASSSLENMLSVMQSAIYFNFTNLDVSHTLQSVLHHLSRKIHASLLHYVICCKSPYGLSAYDFGLKYALPVCKHNFYQMPSQHMTAEVLTMIADQDDLCLASESQLAEAMVSAECTHLLKHVRLDTNRQPLSSLPSRTGFSVSAATKIVQYNGLHVEVDWQGFFFVIETYLTNGFGRYRATECTCVCSSRQDKPAHIYREQSSHSIAIHALVDPIRIWMF